jgi:hypothetical protein
MFERAVIPNGVRDLTNDDGLRNQIRVSRVSSEGSFSSARGIRVTRGVV